MDDPNVNVMVEAKKEYTAQLCNIMCPFMIETFVTMYNEAENLSKGKKVLLQFQRLLKEVPNWNNHMVSEHNDRMNNNCSWFNDLLAAVFVSNVKILSSVRLRSQSAKISVKLPTNERFIHACYINAAKDLYKDPYMFTEEDEFEEALTKRFIAVIMTTVQEMIPVQEILKTYISQDSNLEQVEVESVMDEEPEAEVEEEHEEETPEPIETEEENNQPVEHESQPVVAQEEEAKNIPIDGGAEEEDDGVLFGDAPEQKPSV